MENATEAPLVEVDESNKIPSLKINDPKKAEELLAGQLKDFEDVLNDLNKKVKEKYEGVIWDNGEDIKNMHTALSHIVKGMNAEFVVLSDVLRDESADTLNKTLNYNDRLNFVSAYQQGLVNDCELAFQYVKKGGDTEGFSNKVDKMLISAGVPKAVIEQMTIIERNQWLANNRSAINMRDIFPDDLKKAVRALVTKKRGLASL